MSGYSFCLAKWENDHKDIGDIRNQVLLAEVDQRWEFGSDDAENDAFHVIVYDSNSRPVATGRMQPDGCIDYVAVRRPWRNATVGRAVITYLVHIAQVRGLDSVYCKVPSASRRFFEKSGFHPSDDLAEPGAFKQKFVRNVPPRGTWKITIQ